MNFEERLNYVLQDRKQTPWGQSLGFTSTSISSMFKGHTPGPEFLQGIRRAENVNLNWLLTGEGAPYIVEHFHSADALSDYVCAMLHDEEWGIHIVSHIDKACIVLSQPGAYEFKGKLVNYRIVHVLVGPGDEVLKNVLEDCHTGGNPILVPELSEEQIQNIISGQIGTYHLFQAENPVLPSQTELKLDNIQFTEATQKEHSVNIATMRTVLRITTELEIKHEVELSIEQKARVIAVVYKQVSSLDLKLSILPDQAVIAAVEAAFDMLVD
ncbi:transcriptional regulator [Vibrio sp. Y2-5]|uniref:transcriptional regulator n=1 Tax=Vibrio sp. Y2-5 TaxID=2743977 RepID=UPI0016610AA2|nr:transcriptional regulator [Vibrio sp. Y2-5]MBD0786707.1 transcriptional regulator [Vibrio sp. Y2-5]